MRGAEELNQQRGKISEYTCINNVGLLKTSYCICHWVSKEANAVTTNRPHSLKPYDKDLFVGMIGKNYLFAYLLTCLLIYLITCLLTYLTAYLLTYLLAYLLTYLLIYFLAYLLTYLLTYLLHGAESFLRS